MNPIEAEIIDDECGTLAMWARNLDSPERFVEVATDSLAQIYQNDEWDEIDLPELGRRLQKFWWGNHK